MRLRGGDQVEHVPSGLTGTVIEVDEAGVVLVRDSSWSLDWEGFWSAPVEDVRRRVGGDRRTGAS